MFDYHFKPIGPLFDGGRVLKSVLIDTVQETADFGINKIKDRSPVRTGRLRAGWYSSINNSSIRIDNPVPYTKYQERRKQMVFKTVPEMSKVLKENLSRQKDRLK